MNKTDHAVRLDPERITYQRTNAGMATIMWDRVSSVFGEAELIGLYNPLSQAIQRMVHSPPPPIRHLILPKG